MNRRVSPVSSSSSQPQPGLAGPSAPNEFILKIKVHPTNSEISVKAHSQLTFGMLAERIQQAHQIPVLQQTILFRGRRPQFTQKLADLQITSPTTLHLVVRDPEFTSVGQQQTVSSPPANPFAQREPPRLQFGLNPSNFLFNSSNIHSHLDQIPLLLDHLSQEMQNMPLPSRRLPNRLPPTQFQRLKAIFDKHLQFLHSVASIMSRSNPDRFAQYLTILQKFNVVFESFLKISANQFGVPLPRAQIYSRYPPNTSLSGFEIPSDAGMNGSPAFSILGAEIDTLSGTGTQNQGQIGVLNNTSGNPGSSTSNLMGSLSQMLSNIVGGTTAQAIIPGFVPIGNVQSPRSSNRRQNAASNPSNNSRQNVERSLRSPSKLINLSQFNFHTKSTLRKDILRENSNQSTEIHKNFTVALFFNISHFSSFFNILLIGQQLEHFLEKEMNPALHQTCNLPVFSSTFLHPGTDQFFTHFQEATLSLSQFLDQIIQQYVIPGRPQPFYNFCNNFLFSKENIPMLENFFVSVYLKTNLNSYNEYLSSLLHSLITHIAYSLYRGYSDLTTVVSLILSNFAPQYVENRSLFRSIETVVGNLIPTIHSPSEFSLAEMAENQPIITVETKPSIFRSLDNRIQNTWLAQISRGNFLSSSLQTSDPSFALEFLHGQSSSHPSFYQLFCMSIGKEDSPETQALFSSHKDMFKSLLTEALVTTALQKPSYTPERYPLIAKHDVKDQYQDAVQALDDLVKFLPPNTLNTASASASPLEKHAFRRDPNQTP